MPPGLGHPGAVVAAVRLDPDDRRGLTHGDRPPAVVAAAPGVPDEEIPGHDQEFRISLAAFPGGSSENFGAALDPGLEACANFSRRTPGPSGRHRRGARPGPGALQDPASFSSSALLPQLAASRIVGGMSAPVGLLSRPPALRVWGGADHPRRTSNVCSVCGVQLSGEGYRCSIACRLTRDDARTFRNLLTFATGRVYGLAIEFGTAPNGQASGRKGGD